MRYGKVLLQALAAALIAADPVVQADAAVFINEIHYDNSGTDAGEFIEIAGPAGTDLSTYALLLYNGSDRMLYDSDALSGMIPDQQNGFGTVALGYPTNGIQNGAPDGIALAHAGVVLQFLSYEGVFMALDGVAAGMTSVNIGIGESGTDAAGLSLQLQGAGSVYADFTWGGPLADSPDAINAGQRFLAPALPEPGSLALVAAALLGLLLLRYRTLLKKDVAIGRI